MGFGRLLIYRILLFYFLASILCLLDTNSVYAYSETTTHPALTDQTIKFFEKQYSNYSISQSEKDAIIRGSKDEDNNLKWFNHFYDPIYNRGLTIADDEWPSAKQWGSETKYQKRFVEGTISDYFSHVEDYSWERAIYDFAWGNRTRGLEGLGHVLHLIQDMTVPDHTRNDPHPPVLDLGSPYEGWTQKFKITNIDIDFLLSDKPVELSSVQKYFDEVALFSNNNFYSKDTIRPVEYPAISIDGTKKHFVTDNVFVLFLMKKTRNGEHALGISKAAFDWRKSTEAISIEDPLVLSDYWRVLSKEAVLNGAGVMKLFFDEVEKEKRTKVLFEKNKSWISKKFEEIWSDMSNFIFGHNENSNTAHIDAIFAEEEVIEPEIHRDSIILNEDVVLEEEFIDTKSTESFLTDTQIEVIPVVSTTTLETIILATSSNQISPGFGGGTPTAVSTVSVVVEETILPPAGGGGSSASEEQETPSIPAPEPGVLVINEIGWAGTRASSSDQWIEIANTTGDEQHLDDVFLVGPDVRISLAGSIPAHSFFLLAKGNDALSGVVIDQVVDFGNALPAGGAVLALEYLSASGTTTTLDTTLDCARWCTELSLESGVSRERFSPALLGTDSASWGDNNSAVTTGRDRNGAVVYGTPRARNSLDYLINRNEAVLSGTVTLTKARSPYVISRGTLSIEQGGKLVIEPGVTIKALQGGIRVRGALQVEGTGEEPIKFTSLFDDTILGDTNGDSTDTTPRAGDWDGLLFEETASNLPVSNTVIRYAGGGQNTGASLYISVIPLTVQNTTIENGAGTGIFLDRTPAHIHHSTVQFITAPQGQGVGVGISSSDALIEENIISNNGIGITTAGSAHVIRNNRLDNNSSIPLGLVTLTGGSVSGNSGSGNGINAIVLSDRFLASGTTTFGANGLPYFHNSSRLLEGTALLVEPGAVFKFENTSLEINGALTLRGTAERPIIFTSTDDDTDGNDARADGETPITQRPIRALNISGAGRVEIQHAQFKNSSVGINYENSSSIDLRSVFFKNLVIGVRSEHEAPEVVRAEDITSENVQFLTEPSNLFQNSEN